MLNNFPKKLGIKFSLNDSGWGRGSNNDNEQPPHNNGKRPSNGPPDLDQLWQEFNQRLKRMTKRQGNNGGSNHPSSYPEFSGHGAGMGIIAIIAIILVLWLASGFFIVQEGQTGVIMTFGKYTRMAPAGFNWRWPSPIQRDEIVNVSQVRTAEIGYRASIKNKQSKESLMLTDDENIIDIQFAVQYKIKNAADWLFNNNDTGEIVKLAAETSIREVVGRSKMDFVLYEGREKVAQDVAALIQKILDNYKSGVEISNVTMQTVQPPEQVQNAFDDAVKAGQDRERLKNEAQAYANDVIPKARGAAARLMEESQGYRDRVIASAEGDASRFDQVLAAYHTAPAVTRKRMYLDTMQQIFSNTSKVMIDTKNNSNLLYLPLDKLISQTGASSGTHSTQDIPPPTTGPANSIQNTTPPASPSTQQVGNNILYPSDNPYLRSRDLRGQESR